MRNENKNLAIANIARQLRTQYVEGIYRPKYYTMTLKSSLRVTQGHWKRNHWIDHTRLTISRVIILTLNIIVTLKCGLEITQGHWKWYHLKAWVRFSIRLPFWNCRICNHFGDIQRQRMAWLWNLGLGSFKVIENGAVWETIYDFLFVRHCDYIVTVLYHLQVIWRWIIP